MSDSRSVSIPSSRNPRLARLTEPGPDPSHSPVWYLTLYLAGLLLTNGLADAVHSLLHQVL
jgi:hypothetical protein